MTVSEGARNDKKNVAMTALFVIARSPSPDWRRSNLGGGKGYHGVAMTLSFCHCEAQGAEAILCPTEIATPSARNDSQGRLAMANSDGALQLLRIATKSPS